MLIMSQFCIQTTATAQNDVILLHHTQRFIHISHKDTKKPLILGCHVILTEKDSATDFNDTEEVRQCMCDITL
jgi:hypothetical protein